MHLYLIGLSLPSLATLWVWVQVALGLGAVIFIHELGHFVVAKLCGVKCEKFYLGFDIGGWKLLHFKWGETEYGIGILPLGGYVKMLGQEDNPAAAAEEMERAKASGGDGKPVYDPRSFQAQSVPERMAIISAGVVMNVIFAFAANTAAFSLGVAELPCIVSDVAPGEPAWQAGLRTGAVVTRIEDKDKEPRFDKDLVPYVVLADMEKGVSMDVLFPGETKPTTLVVKPRKYAERKKPTIGIITFPKSLTFTEWTPKPNAAAYRTQPELKAGDKIVKVGDKPVATYADLVAILTERPGEALSLTIERPEDPKKADSAMKELKVELPANPLKTFGFEVALGPIVAVQDNSPAAKAGLKPGDQIETIDGQAPGDPMTLDERLRRRGLKDLTLKVKRSGESQPLEIVVAPRAAPWIESPIGDNSPVPLPMLGIAYQTGHTVAGLDADGPAAKAGLKVGDELTSVTVQLPDGAVKKGDENPYENSITLASDDPTKGNLATVLTQLQMLPDNIKVAFETKDGRKVEVKSVASKEFHDLDRGLTFAPIRRIRTAESFGEALTLARSETADNVFQVYWFLQKLGTGQVDATNLRGPGTIAKVAGDFAGAGLAHLLTFLAMLSANLAVINFLPIPLLDGGHMVFLIWEGIRGKPASERVQVTFQYVGLLLIGTLMLFVITMDVTDFVGYLSRRFG